MCITIVPLAGPDFYTNEFGIRPLYLMNGVTIMESVLSKRPWIGPHLNEENQLIFILREEQPYTQMMLDFIKKRFPLSTTVVLGAMSAGAPFSALAGISLFRRNDIPVVIDLADIMFDISSNPAEYFSSCDDVDAVLPYFISQEPKLSYLEIDNDLNVLQAREKQVISSNASAGVYFFRNASVYLRAMIFCIENIDICKVNSMFFICPSVNGLISENRKVRAVEVHNVNSMSSFFKQQKNGN